MFPTMQMDAHAQKINGPREGDGKRANLLKRTDGEQLLSVGVGWKAKKLERFIVMNT